MSDTGGMKHFTGHEIHDSEQTNGLIVFVVVGHPAGMSWFHKGDGTSFDVTCRLRKCKWQITQGICNLLHHTLVTLPDNTRTDSSRENTLRSKESPDSSQPSFLQLVTIMCPPTGGIRSCTSKGSVMLSRISNQPDLLPGLSQTRRI